MSYRDDVNDVVRETRWGFFQFFFFLIFPIMVLFGAGGLAWHFIMKPIDVIDKVTDPDRMINNYEWFIQQDKDIQACQRQIINAKQAESDYVGMISPPDKRTFDERNEVARLHSVTVGLQQERESLVADYNAHTDERTRNFLKTKNLPDHYE